MLWTCYFITTTLQGDYYCVHVYKSAQSYTASHAKLEVKLWEGDKLLTNLHPRNKQLSRQAWTCSTSWYKSASKVAVTHTRVTVLQSTVRLVVIVLWVKWGIALSLEDTHRYPTWVIQHYHIWRGTGGCWWLPQTILPTPLPPSHPVMATSWGDAPGSGQHLHCHTAHWRDDGHRRRD